MGDPTCIGEVFRFLRLRHEMTLREFCRRCRCSTVLWSRFERGALISHISNMNDDPTALCVRFMGVKSHRAEMPFGNSSLTVMVSYVGDPVGAIVRDPKAAKQISDFGEEGRIVALWDPEKRGEPKPEWLVEAEKRGPTDSELIRMYSMGEEADDA